MKTEKKIIKLFIEKKKTYTIREISKEIMSDYKIVNIAANRLIDKRIIIAKNIGKSRLCELNNLYFG